MLRKDKLTIKREVYELVKGESVNHKNIVIKEDVPCHLSCGLNSTTTINNTPYLISEFTLFLDSALDIDIKENDLLFVKTSKNQEYNLISGEVKIYNMSIQIKCKQIKIIESKT